MSKRTAYEELHPDAPDAKRPKLATAFEQLYDQIRARDTIVLEHQQRIKEITETIDDYARVYMIQTFKISHSRVTLSLSSERMQIPHAFNMAASRGLLVNHDATYHSIMPVCVACPLPYNNNIISSLLIPISSTTDPTRSRINCRRGKIM